MSTRQLLFAIALICLDLPSAAIAAETDCNTVIAHLARNVNSNLALGAMVTTSTAGASPTSVIPDIATTTIVFALAPYEVRNRASYQILVGLQGSGLQYFSNRFAHAGGPFSGQADDVTARITGGYPAQVALISQSGALIWSGVPQCEERGFGAVGVMHGLSDDGTLAFTVSLTKYHPSTTEGPFHN